MDPWQIRDDAAATARSRLETGLDFRRASVHIQTTHESLNTSGETFRQAVVSRGGNVIEFIDLVTGAPISTPGGFNAGEYRGISHGAADIFGFQISNMYIVADDVTVDITATPEPASGLLVLTGLAGVFMYRRRRTA